MPNRIVREGIIESEAVNNLSWAAEVFYRRLLNKVDDYGRFEANVKLLRAALYPLKLDKVSDRDTQGWLQETAEAGLVKVYEVDGKAYLEVQKFQQRVRASKSKYPPPIEHDGHMSAICQSNARHVSDTCSPKAEAESKTNNTMVRGSTTVAIGAAVAPPPTPAPYSDDFRGWLAAMCGCVEQLAAFRVLPGDVLEAASEAWRQLPQAVEYAGLLRAYYADRMPMDSRKAPFWRPMGAQFFRELGDVIFKHALRWKRETGWKDTNTTKTLKPKAQKEAPPPCTPEEQKAFLASLRSLRDTP